MPRINMSRGSAGVVPTPYTMPDTANGQAVRPPPAIPAIASHSMFTSPHRPGIGCRTATAGGPT